MIKYLQKYDPEMPDNLDLLMRASLQKRVIHCMKRRQNANSSPFPPAAAESAPIPWPQSAHPNQRFSRKRRADCPLTGALMKRMKMSAHEPLPIKTLMDESPRHEEKEQDVDFSSLCRLSITPNDQDSGDDGSDVWIERLLERVKKGIPARYDILPLPHPVLNLDADTAYLRSTKMHKLYGVCHTENNPSPSCYVRTMDDVYHLNDAEIERIESSVSDWVLKNGEYSSNIHPSVHETDDHSLCATNHVFQYEVLGRFIGDEMIESEFQEIYASTFDEYRRSLHSWVFEVIIPIIDNAADSNAVRYESYDMLVDCLGKTEKAPSKLLLVEDCRADPGKENTTKEDLKRENVLFITIEINGWPGKFAVAKRTIQRDEVLVGHFGDGYGSLKKHVERQQQSVDHFVSSIERLLKPQTSISQQ